MTQRGKPSRAKPSARTFGPSAHDVAHLAGVSQAAVSRAFTPGASISEVTRAKVLKAAAELGYRPNLLARSLIRGKSGIVGVVIGNPRNPFFLEALNALSERLSAADLHLLVFTAQANQNADELVESLLRFRVDALVLMSAVLSTELAERCRSEDIPIIFFHRRPRMLEGFVSVTGANFAGGSAIATHLVEQGYRRLAFMGGFESSSISQEREAGFVAKIVEHGMAMPGRAFGNYDRAGAVVAARQLLKSSPRPDAIFCANDMMGLATIEVARDEFGLKVGPELGVAGFDDIEGASWSSFDMTTYSQPVEKMIEQVSQLIVAGDGALDAPNIIVVEGELKIRSSTRRRA